MATNSYFISVYITQFINRVNSSFSVGNQLLDKRIIGFGITLTYNREGGIVKHHIAAGHPVHHRPVIRIGKLIGV